MKTPILAIILPGLDQAKFTRHLKKAGWIKAQTNVWKTFGVLSEVAEKLKPHLVCAANVTLFAISESQHITGPNFPR